jgi:hypothetical protein
MKTAFLVTLLFCGAIASGQTMDLPEKSGNAFVRFCSAVDKDKNTEEEIPHVWGCLGYVEGLVEGMDGGYFFYENSMKGPVTRAFCVPPDTSHGQLVRIVLKFIRNNPEEAHKRTAFLIVEAINKAFPCPAPRP